MVIRLIPPIRIHFCNWMAKILSSLKITFTLSFILGNLEGTEKNMWKGRYDIGF